MFFCRSTCNCKKKDGGRHHQSKKKRAEKRARRKCDPKCERATNDPIFYPRRKPPASSSQNAPREANSQSQPASRRIAHPQCFIGDSLLDKNNRKVHEFFVLLPLYYLPLFFPLLFRLAFAWRFRGHHGNKQQAASKGTKTTRCHHVLSSRTQGTN